jgi:uncharacterized short protein YbdD (DUF466 family)
MKKILQFLSLIKKSLNGDLAYENYLAHAQKNHDGKVLDKRSFLLQRQNEKSKKVNRCC